MIEDFTDPNRYKVVNRIAQGGMGAIYEVRQLGAEGFEKTMALKIILEEFCTDPEFVEMFIGEAKLVADLIHENIVQVYQLGKVKGFYYIAMEYIHGINLNEFVQRHHEQGRELDLELAVFIVSRVCRGLEYAHSKADHHGKKLGVVHRDVSPANVLMNFEGVVKLTDFGIAKAQGFLRNQEGEVLMGKIRYMSPEQAEYKQTDGRSDIFSLGVVAYELLTGTCLFEAEDTETTLQNVSVKEVPPIREVNAAVPADVERILAKALDRDLTKRYQTAGEMSFDLEYYMYHDRYGPTNQALRKYLLDLFPDRARPAAEEPKQVPMETSTIALILEDLEKEE